MEEKKDYIMTIPVTSALNGGKKPMVHWDKISAGIWRTEPNLYKVIVRLRINGNIEHRQETFQGTKEQAKDKLAQFKRELRSCKCSLTNAILQLRTFKELMALFQEKRGDLSSSHEDKIELLVEDLGSVSLNQFADKFETYLKRLWNTPILFKGEDKKVQSRKRSAASINRRIEIVRAAFHLCLNLGAVSENPITKSRFPRLKEIPRDITLTKEERLELLNVIDKEAPHLSAIVRFALQVPCRKSELVNMRKDDLDLFTNTIRLRNGTTKNDRGCYKPIPPDMLEYFRSIPAEAEYLFYRKIINKETKAVTYAGLGLFQRSWRRCLKLAGLKGFHFHDTRHIAATALIDNGTPEQVVMTVANWKTNMLRNYYHREPKKALELVRFSPHCDSRCDSAEAKVA